MFDNSLPPRDAKAWQAHSALHAARDAMAFVAWQAPAHQDALTPESQQALAAFEAHLEAEDGTHAPSPGRTPDPLMARFATPKPPPAAGFQRTVYPPIQTRSSVPNALTSDPRGLVALPAEPDEPVADAAHAQPGAAHDETQDETHDEAEVCAQSADPQDDGPRDDAPIATPAEGAQDVQGAQEAVAQEALAPDAAPLEPVQADGSEVSAPQDATASDDPGAEVTEAALAEDGLLEPQAMAEMERECEESLALQGRPVGIDPEDVARREAEHYQRGHEDGERAVREALAQEIAAQRTVLEGVTQQLHALLKDPQAYFEPMKRLAMHLAEHIVQGELRTSSQAIEHLIQRCLDALDHPAQGPVVVELHPQDKARLQEAAPELIRGMRLQTSPDLRPGSVRLFANDTQVQDLIEHRLHAMARNLSLDTDAWQAHCVLLQDEAPETTEASAAAPAPAPQEDDDAHS